MRFEVMVRNHDDRGEIVAWHEGDTLNEVVATFVDACRADPTVTYLGVALDGEYGRLWTVGDIEQAAEVDAVEDLAAEARDRTHYRAVRAYVLGMPTGKALRMSDLAAEVGASVGDVAPSVSLLVVAGYLDQSEDTVTRSPWAMPVLGR